MKMETKVKQTKGKQALGKCPHCGSTKKALYEKRWNRWIVVAHYCPRCGAVEWNRKYEPPNNSSRQFNEFWKMYIEQMEKQCNDCPYKRMLDESLRELQKKLSSL